MAKQSGLHQIKGKVEGYSYYRQSGVKDGLMRRINEGLSSRVKTSEEFANTRLNNSEFGNAADVAKVLASVITPKYRPMFLNFSQAKLTKSLLALIKQASADWGQRALSSEDVAAVCDAANMLAKNDFGALCDSLTSTAGAQEGETSVNISFTADNVSALAAFGADGVVAKASAVAVYAGQYSAAEHGYIKSIAKALQVTSNEFALDDLPTDSQITLTGDGDDVSGTAKILVSLVIIMPYRLVNGKKYTLQEKCTFKMIPTIINEGA